MNVLLSDSEYDSLLAEYGKELVDEAILLLSTKIARVKNSPYANEMHYATIKAWVITAVLEQRARAGGTQSRPKKSRDKPSNGFDVSFEDMFESP